MAAGGLLVLLLAVLNLSIFAHHCDAQELRCQCLQVFSQPIPLSLIKTMQVIPRNIYCSRDEVIATLKNGKLICLDPKAKWVTALIEMILHRKRSPQTWPQPNLAEANPQLREVICPADSSLNEVGKKLTSLATSLPTVTRFGETRFSQAPTRGPQRNETSSRDEHREVSVPP